MSNEGVSRTLSITYELGKTIMTAVVVMFLIHYFVVTIFMVDGVSMEPNFHTGQIVMVNKLAYLTSSPKRGDVVVLRFPGDPKNSRYVKRIIGLPGETIIIKDGKIYIGGKTLRELYLPKGTYVDAENYKSITLAAKEYFVLGDNREASSDGRIWGPTRQEDLIGVTRLVVFPFKDFGYIPAVYY